MFGSNSNMRKHQKTNCISSQKDLVFQCKICPKAFNAEVKLKAHLVAHDGSLNFECKTCQKKWKHKKSLDYHNRKSHPQCTWDKAGSYSCYSILLWPPFCCLLRFTVTFSLVWSFSWIQQILYGYLWFMFGVCFYWFIQFLIQNICCTVISILIKYSN